MKAVCCFLLALFVEWILHGSGEGKNGIVFRASSSFIRIRTKSIFDSFSGVTGGGSGFRSGWGNVISNAISMTFPSSCVGQLINIGYLSSELDEDDYPYNPNCGSQSLTNNLCFPGSSLVTTKERGEIELKDLNLGEHVLVRDFNTMELRYSRVEVMLHKDENLHVNDEWIQVSYLGMRKPLVLSPNHLIFIQYLGESPQEGSCFEPNLVMNLVGVEVTPLSGRKVDIYSVQAKDIMVGDSVIIDSRERISWVTGVSLISSLENQLKERKYVGRYAPFTTDGYLIVNGVLVSSYSRPYPWPMDLLNPSHWLIDLLARPFINIEIRLQTTFTYTRNWIKRVLEKIGDLSPRYTFDQTTALTLEIVRAISLFVK